VSFSIIPPQIHGFFAMMLKANNAVYIVKATINERATFKAVRLVLSKNSNPAINSSAAGKVEAINQPIQSGKGCVFIASKKTG